MVIFPGGAEASHWCPLTGTHMQVASSHCQHHKQQQKQSTENNAAGAQAIGPERPKNPEGPACHQPQRPRDDDVRKRAMGYLATVYFRREYARKEIRGQANHRPRRSNQDPSNESVEHRNPLVLTHMRTNSANARPDCSAVPMTRICVSASRPYPAPQRSHVIAVGVVVLDAMRPCTDRPSRCVSLGTPASSLSLILMN